MSNLTWVKEVIVDDVHTLEYPPVNKQTADGWIINYNLNPEAMAADGYEQWTDEQIQQWHDRYDPPVPPYVRKRCTKYQLVNCLRTHFPALLEQLRAAYKASENLQFFWNTVNDLDRDNADFQSAVQQLGITGEQLDEIFCKIEGQEPEAVNVD